MRNSAHTFILVGWFGILAIGCGPRRATAERTIVRPQDNTPIVGLDTMVPIAVGDWSGPRALQVAPWEFRLTRLDAEGICVNVLQRTVVDDYDAQIPWNELRGTIDFEGEHGVRVRSASTEAGPVGQEVYAGQSLHRVQSGFETYCTSTGCRTEPTFRQVARPGNVLVNTAQQNYCFPAAEFSDEHNAILFYLDRVQSGSYGLASNRRTVRWVFGSTMTMETAGGESPAPAPNATITPSGATTTASR